MSNSPANDQLEAILTQIESLQEDGQFDEALEMAREAIRKHPKAIEPRFMCGMLLWELGQEEEALAAFEEGLEIDKKDPHLLLASADLLLTIAESPEDFERAADLCRRARKSAKKLQEDEMEGESLFLEALALSTLDRGAEALPLLDEAEAILGADPELLQVRGVALFELARFEEARRDLQTLAALEADAAVAYHYLGLLEERAGRHEEAKGLFEKAQQLSPEEFPPPIHLSEEDFDRVVEEAIAALPKKVHDYLGNVAITVERIPSDADVSGADPLSPTLLGVFRGTPIGEKGLFDPWSHFPDSIVLYQSNLERFAMDREELLDEIAVTLIHEVGHFLGLSEEDLEAMDLD